MSFTYNPEQIDPAQGDPISAVRFLLQDTIEAEAELSDEEIGAVYATTEAALTQAQRVYLTSALCAEAIAVKYSREVNFNSGGTSIDAKGRYESWKQTLQRLVSQAREAVTGSGLGVTYAGRNHPTMGVGWEGWY